MNLKTKLMHVWTNDITDEQREILNVQFLAVYVIGVFVGVSSMWFLYKMFG